MRTWHLRLLICACGLPLLMLAAVALSLGLAAAQEVGTLTRITTASDSDRESWAEDLSADGTIIAINSNSDLLGQGITNEQWEIWLYDTVALTYTRVTSASGSTRESYYPCLSADGTLVAFSSDSDLLKQGIADEQFEI